MLNNVKLFKDSSDKCIELSITSYPEYIEGDTIIVKLMIMNISKDTIWIKYPMIVGYSDYSIHQRDIYFEVIFPPNVEYKGSRILVANNGPCPDTSDFYLLIPNKYFIKEYDLSNPLHWYIHEKGIYSITAYYENYWDYPLADNTIKTWLGKLKSNELTITILEK